MRGAREGERRARGERVEVERVVREGEGGFGREERCGVCGEERSRGG